MVPFAVMGLGPVELVLLTVVLPVAAIVLVVRAIRFSGSSDVAFQSTQPPQQVFAQIQDCLESLGGVSMDKSGSFEIGGTKFNGFGYKSTIDGSVRSKEGRYVVNVDWTVKPAILAGLIVTCLFPIGLLVLLLPYNAKSEIERKVERALSSLKFEATGR